jgi:hypothetical protein
MLCTPLLMAALGVEPIDPREFDRARIQRHLAAVEADLRARDTSHLPPTLRRERSRNLDRLRAYRLTGEFPRNSDHPGERVPYFIDDDGVVCAVGHLVVESGFVAVAEEIHATENNTRLLDMTHAALPAWIAASGLTAEECARIQPNYCNCGDDYAPVCGVDGKTYYNACYAETCADVAIAHDGPCLGPGTTGWPNAGTDGSESTASETGTSETGTSETSTSGSDSGPVPDSTSSGIASSTGGTADTVTSSAGETAGTATSSGETTETITSSAGTTAVDASAGGETTTDAGASSQSTAPPDSAGGDDSHGCGCRHTANAPGALLALHLLVARRRVRR